MDFRCPALCVPLLSIGACFDPQSDDDSGATEGATEDATTSTGGDTQTPPTGGDPTGNDSTVTPGTDTSDGTSTTSDPGTDDSTGEPPGLPSICKGTWHDWFSESFDDVPDGDFLGITDLPRTPWATVIGNAAVADGALTGYGGSLASQGLPIPLETARVRFRLVAVDASNEFIVGINSPTDGSSVTLAILVDAMDGSVSMGASNMELDTQIGGALDLGEEYFVEFEIDQGEALVRLSKGAYATEPGSELINSLEGVAIPALAPERSVIAVTTAEGAPKGADGSLDDISISVCDQPPPEREDVFVDHFDRPNADLLGAPEVPAGGAWIDFAGDGFSIFSNRLRDSTGFVAYAPAASVAGRDNTLLRAVAQLTGSGRCAAGWGIPGGGGPYDNDLGFGFSSLGFTNVHADTVSGDGMFAPAVGQDYFVEVAVSGAFGAMTIRSDSFDGPLVLGLDVDGIPDLFNEAGDNHVMVGSEQGGNCDFDELVLTRYGMP